VRKPSATLGQLRLHDHRRLNNNYRPWHQPGNNWWQPSESFPSEINDETGGLYTGNDPFRWSGVNGDPERRLAAQELVDWVGQHIAPDGFLRLICHSHGGNVAMLATCLGLRIDHLVLLGTPIRLDYLPDMRNIGYVHNIYCPWDDVQDIGCIGPFRPFRGAPLRPTMPIMRLHRGDGRTLTDTDRILNCAAISGVGGAFPSHSDLHDWNVWRQNGFDAFLR
jgi:hypothetical protein